MKRIKAVILNRRGKKTTYLLKVKEVKFSKTLKILKWQLSTLDDHQKR